MAHMIAVYGSLLSDLHNHGLLKEGKLIDIGYIKGTLYSLGSFPGLKLQGNTPVKVEVYEVDNATLARLDRLEGHPTFYTRKDAEAIVGENQDQSMEVMVYEWQGTVRNQPLVESGDWKDYYLTKESDRG